MPRRFTLMVPLLLVAAMVAALGGPTTRLSAQSGASRVPPITRPEPVAPGVYPLYDYRNLSTSQYHVVGGHQSFDWRTLQPGENNFNWGPLDNWIAAEWAAGKPVAIGIEIYNPSIQYRIPDYVVQGAPPIACGANGSRKVPRYWHSYFLQEYRDFILALGARYRNDPRVVWIQIGAGIWQETQPESGTTNKECVKQAMIADLGTSDPLTLSRTWSNTVNSIQQAYKDAFGSDKPVMLMYVPYFLDYRERDGWGGQCEGFVPYALCQGIGFKHAGLLPDHWVGTGYNPIKNNWGTVSGAFEPPSGYTNDQEIYWAVFAALDAHADYLTLHPNHFLNDCGNQSNGCGYDMNMVFAQYDFFNTYAGKRPSNTPGAWVALRDSWYRFGSHDNYSWLLYQDLDQPGAIPKSVSHMSGPTQGGQQVNAAMSTDSTIGTFKESRWTRRTDAASGNPNMLFFVDDAYLAGGSTPVEFQITYFDKGSDQWRLVYDGPGTTTPVGYTQTKTNTNRWKTATFVVNDAEFANQLEGNNDFRLESMGDGDEYFHLIKLAPTAPRTCPWGDRDGSGEVDVGDLTLLASIWWQENTQHDVDGDGRITVLDIQTAAEEWGQRCTYGTMKQ